MGKKRGEAADADAFRVEGEEEAPKDEGKVDLGDGIALKRALDEAAIQAVADAGHIVDNRLTDLKIVLGFVACAIAGGGYLYSKKHPEAWWAMVACVATYALLSCLMTAVAALFEKDAILLTRAAAGGPPALALSSRLPRFEEAYTLRVALRNPPRKGSAAGGSGGGGGGGGQTEASITKSVGAYFHSDGHLAADVIRRDTEQLLKRFLEAKMK